MSSKKTENMAVVLDDFSQRALQLQMRVEEVKKLQAEPARKDAFLKMGTCIENLDGALTPSRFLGQTLPGMWTPFPTTSLTHNLPEVNRLVLCVCVCKGYCILYYYIYFVCVCV